MNGRREYSLGIAGVAMLAGLLGSGCATNRGIIDVRVTAPQNPASGHTVMIARVTDGRVFEAAPPQASIPSLKNGEIGDKAITSRAIARKRNGYGKALGDIVLPEGRTVEALVREALVKSFRDAGYRVVDGADKGDAVPIEADIEQFWAWVTPGFWALSMEFEAKVKIKGDVPSFKNGETVRGYIELHTQAAGTGAWRNTIDKGIAAFVEEVKKRLAKQ
jgi:hypothetical protein